MYCEKKRPGLFSPKGNKKLNIVIDDLHMPRRDIYNT